MSVDPSLVVGRPGWLCDHFFSRDICPYGCADTVREWLEGKEPKMAISKTELAETLRKWLCMQGLAVSNLDGTGFKIQLHDEEKDTLQVYQLNMKIPRDKSFKAADDTDEIRAAQETEDEPEEPD